MKDLNEDKEIKDVPNVGVATIIFDFLNIVLPCVVLGLLLTISLCMFIVEGTFAFFVMAV